ncbi:calcium and integrin-binding family member 2-like [Lineus longissimus]|uniref:calcium and integrin-binding family member 2-like n=1 Tax=Lineus longissimus TaxID=88925 RepID=UPI002B4C7D9B
MGNKQTIFSDEQLEAYQDCTFFTRDEILRIYSRFRELEPTLVPEDMSGNETSTVKMPYNKLEAMQELKENPFHRRVCEVFSEDGSGDMTFNDFLDMFSVFSEAAPRDIKSTYAFKIYDFDGDNHIGREDLEHTLNSLTKNELTAEEIEFAIDKVLEEADLDDDGSLSYMEFEHVISRAPDFLSTFHIRI